MCGGMYDDAMCLWVCVCLKMLSVSQDAMCV